MSNSTHNSDEPKAPPSLIDRFKEVFQGRAYSTAPQRIRFWAGVTATFFAVLTMVFLLLADKNTCRPLSQTMLVLWAVLPPMWFWFEYVVLWEHEKRLGKVSPSDFQDFKHQQELSRNIWLAFVGLLVGWFLK
jgi:hypothetical protein